MLDAYGWTDIPTHCKFPEPEGEDEEPLQGGRDRYRYRWPNAVRDEVLSRLLELNAERAEEERRTAKEGAGRR